MDCPQCQRGVLKVTHSYRAGGAGKTASLRCDRCGLRYTLLSLLVGPVEGRGTGAAAWANRLSSESLEALAQHLHHRRRSE